MRQFIRQTAMMVALSLALTGLANAQGDPESWPTYDPPTNQQSDPKIWPEAKSSSAATAGPSVDGAGLRAGLGTDISGGVAYGVALTYVKMLGLNGLELQFGAYGGTFKETTEEFHTY